MLLKRFNISLKDLFDFFKFRCQEEFQKDYLEDLGRKEYAKTETEDEKKSIKAGELLENFNISNILIFLISGNISRVCGPGDEVETQIPGMEQIH